MRLLAVLFFGFPGFAFADVWEGIWAASPEWCANVGSIGESENAPIRITPSKIDGLENSCEISNVTPTGVGQSWRFDQNCWAEGTNYRKSELIMINHRGLLVRFGDDGYTIVYTRC